MSRKRLDRNKLHSDVLAELEKWPMGVTPRLLSEKVHGFEDDMHQFHILGWLKANNLVKERRLGCKSKLIYLVKYWIPWEFEEHERETYELKPHKSPKATPQ